MKRRAIVPYLVLSLGVLIASSAAILIRLAQEQGMPSLVIAASRLTLAALILTPVAWSRVGAELRTLQRRHVWLGIGSGAFLALHFGAWISSLEYTSVASSVALVTTNPLWVGLAAFVFYRERLHWATVSGIVLTISGSILIGYSDSVISSHANPLLGNALALLGALMVSGYFLIGHTLRQRLSLLAYIWLVYSAAAATLLVVTVLTGQALLGYSYHAYGLVLGLAIGPQLLGHTAFNWALRYLSATFVAIAILGEPIGSALLALVWFGEQFAPLQLVGFVLLLVGIYVATFNEHPAVPKQADEAVSSMAQN